MILWTLTKIFQNWTIIRKVTNFLLDQWQLLMPILELEIFWIGILWLKYWLQRSYLSKFWTNGIIISVLLLLLLVENKRHEYIVWNMKPIRLTTYLVQITHFSVKVTEIYSHTFPQKLCEINDFTKEITKYVVALTKDFSILSHRTIKSDHDFCGKINIFPVKSTFLLKKLLMSWFHGKFLSTVWKLQKFSHTFFAKISWKQWFY